MAAIDDKMHALNFNMPTSKTPSQLTQLIADAAEMASTTGPKVTITSPSPGVFAGVVKNFARITQGTFTLSITNSPNGAQSLAKFVVGDYMRTRETLFYIIPISPWGAPAYKTIRAFSEYLRSQL